MRREQLLQKIRQAGVVGAGGAGFPTYKKLDARVEYIIANGAECEPLLYKDREVMLQEVSRFIAGLQIMQNISGAKQVTIAVKRKNSDVIDLLGPALKQAGFEAYIMEDVYPAGDEYILVYEVTGRRIPPGGIPLQVGVIVENVETVVNIANAVDDQPVVDKYVTVTGAVHWPVTTIVPVGISFAECLDLAGGATTSEVVVLTGGVMMGGVATDLSLPVSKTIGGLIVLPAAHPLIQKKSAPKETFLRIGHWQCDQCSFCTELCPRYILGYPIQPHRVMRTLLMSGDARMLHSLWAQYCCECNVCSLIACPENLDPKNVCVEAKKLLQEHNFAWEKRELEAAFLDVHPARPGRQIPIPTLYQRLGLKPYDRQAPFTPTDPTPSHVKIPLQAHIGQPAQPQVEAGQAVGRGDVIATVDSKHSGCPVHASIDGYVTAITQENIQISTSSGGSAL